MSTLATPQAQPAQRASTRLPVAVVILTHNEEPNIRGCLESVTPWAAQVFVVDSFSDDATVETAGLLGATTVQHEFEGYSEQRNWALDELPIDQDWVLTLDADERASEELVSELAELFEGSRDLERVSAFYIKRRLIFMGRWIRNGGYYPIWLARLYRRSRCRWNARSVNEHLIVEGESAKLRGDILHDDRRDLSHWVRKHDRYAALEAAELLKRRGSDEAPSSLTGSQAQRKQWIRRNLWERLPLLVRPWIYFLFRYVLLRGFLDGRAGLVYHTLQGLWYPLLIDAKYLEARRR